MKKHQLVDVRKYSMFFRRADKISSDYSKTWLRAVSYNLTLLGGRVYNNQVKIMQVTSPTEVMLQKFHKLAFCVRACKWTQVQSFVYSIGAIMM